MNDVHNPFLPPKAEVFSKTAGQETGVAESRPTGVNIALFLIAAEILHSTTGVISELGRFDPGFSSIVGLLIGVSDVAITIVLWVFLAPGRNWARIVFLILWGMSLVSQGSWTYMSYAAVPESVHYVISWSAVAWMVLPHLLSAAAVVLLYGPGRRWFRDRGIQ